MNKQIMDEKRFVVKYSCLCGRVLLDENLRCEICENSPKVDDMVKIKVCMNCGYIFDYEEPTKGHECP